MADLTTVLTAVSAWAIANPMLVVIILMIVLLLKGLALYKAARKQSIVWFWVIFVVNTLGVLPLLYLIFSRNPRSSD